MSSSNFSKLLEKTFKLKEHNTTPKIEIMAGLTTFMTMAYILIVNPNILSATGMDKGALFTATALSSVVATLVMALHANLPYALAPAMGPNAFFAFTVVIAMGYSWQTALTAVFIEGLIFIILTFFNVREAIVNAIPLVMKKAVSVGIGLFIAFLGLYNAEIVKVGEGVPLAIGNITAGSGLLAVIGILLTGLLMARNVKGGLLIGILVTTLIGIPMGVTHMPQSFDLTPPSLAPIFFKLDFSNIFSLDMAIVVFTFLFVDLFDTVGTLVGVATKANMLDENGNVPKVKQALLSDAIGTTAGAVLGTSTVTTFVESASGVAAGGRTGLTAFTTAVMFAISLFLSPIFTMIPSAATAPALVIVGLFMMSPVKEIDFDDFTNAIPAFLTIIMMPLTYSISEGIVFGMISFVVLKLLTGKKNEISPLMYVITLMFVLKLIIG
jgi:AGZA family xanthine/uracil permease-like MFS transporter